LGEDNEISQHLFVREILHSLETSDDLF